MAQAAGGEPTRFLTLTVNPSVGRDPEERLRLLAHAWRLCVKRIRRQIGDQEIAYLAVVEETKQGEPHLHILLRSPYLPQWWLSAAMAELIQAPVVDIRRIYNRKQVIRYIAKYIAKAPAQFGSSKRYWTSQNWEDRADTKDEAASTALARWQVVMEPLSIIVSRWWLDGFIARKEGKEGIIGEYYGRAQAYTFHQALGYEGLFGQGERSL